VKSVWLQLVYCIPSSWHTYNVAIIKFAFENNMLQSFSAGVSSNKWKWRIPPKVFKMFTSIMFCALSFLNACLGHGSSVKKEGKGVQWLGALASCWGPDQAGFLPCDAMLSSCVWPSVRLLQFYHIFGISEARHFKIHVLIDTDEHYCMRDRLPLKSMCSGSRDFFKFWEMSDNVSETVQDRDIVAVKG